MVQDNKVRGGKASDICLYWMRPSPPRRVEVERFQHDMQRGWALFSDRGTTILRTS